VARKLQFCEVRVRIVPMFVIVNLEEVFKQNKQLSFLCKYEYIRAEFRNVLSEINLTKIQFLHVITPRAQLKRYLFPQCRLGLKYCILRLKERKCLASRKFADKSKQIQVKNKQNPIHG
jgi:hypothetical protein